MVEVCGGGVWWRCVVEVYGGGVWWRCMVEVYGGGIAFAGESGSRIESNCGFSGSVRHATGSNWFCGSFFELRIGNVNRLNRFSVWRGNKIRLPIRFTEISTPSLAQPTCRCDGRDLDIASAQPPESFFILQFVFIGAVRRFFHSGSVYFSGSVRDSTVRRWTKTA